MQFALWVVAAILVLLSAIWEPPPQQYPWLKLFRLGMFFFILGFCVSGLGLR